MTTPLGTPNFCDSTGTARTPDDIQACDSAGTAKRGGVYVCTSTGTRLLVWPTSLPAVTGFTATKSGTNPTSEIDLAWTLVAAKYVYDSIVIERCLDSGGAPDGSWVEIAASPLSRGSTGVTDDTVGDGTTYWYRVFLVFDGTLLEGLEGLKTAQDSATTDYAAPSAAPTHRSGFPKDDINDDDSFLERLLDDPAATSWSMWYRVGSNMGGNPLTGGGTAFPGNPYTRAQIVSAQVDISGFSHGDVIYLNGRASNSGGDGPFMTAAYENANAFSIQMRVPGTPLSLGTLRTGANVELTTTPGSPNNATSYNFEEFYRTSPGGGWIGPTTFSDADGYVAARPIIEGREYYWTVEAENAAGTSPGVATSAVVQYVDTPGTPTGVGLTYVGVGDPSSQLEMTWTAPVSGGTFDAYDIEWIAYASSFTGTPNASSGNDTSETLSSLTDNIRIKARIRAKSTVWSTTGNWSAQADSWTAPSTPGGCTWTSTYPKATAKDTIAMSVLWPTDADEVDFWGGGASRSQVASNTFNWTGLSPDTQYTQIKARGVHLAAVGSPHSDAYGSFSTPDKSVYTLVEAPDITGITVNYSGCPTTMRRDITVSHLNGDGIARSESFYVDIYDGSSWTNWSTEPAGTTAVNNIDIDGADQTIRVYYTSESSTTANTQGIGGIKVCPT